MIEQLEALLASGKDSSTLRFALASRYFSRGDWEQAIEHALVAVRLDADYSAAWRLLGQAQVKAGREPDAIATFRQGLDVAERQGDKQLAREIGVFLKRLET